MFNLPTANFNRRRLLLGLASASAAGATVALAGAATAAVVSENASLLALGDQLPEAEAEMVAATAALGDVLRAWWRKWPTAPDAIVKAYRDDYSRERGIDGSLVGPDGRRDADNARPLYSAKELQRQIASIDSAVKRRRPKHPLTPSQLWHAEAERTMLSGKLALALDYEAAKASVLEGSGYVAARDREAAAREALLALVSRIMAEPEATMAGVVIKAQALTAWAKAPYHAFEVSGWDWPQQLAASLLRIAEEAPAKQA